MAAVAAMPELAVSQEVLAAKAGKEVTVEVVASAAAAAAAMVGSTCTKQVGCQSSHGGDQPPGGRRCTYAVDCQARSSPSHAMCMRSRRKRAAALAQEAVRKVRAARVARAARAAMAAASVAAVMGAAAVTEVWVGSLAATRAEAKGLATVVAKVPAETATVEVAEKAPEGLVQVVAEERVRVKAEVAMTPRLPTPKRRRSR